MIVSGTFNNEKELEIHQHMLEVNGACSIHFTLLKGAFEHFFIEVWDSNACLRAVLTYKTRLTRFIITPDARTTTNYCKCGVLPSGEWCIKVIKPQVVDGGYEFSVTFDEELCSDDDSVYINPMKQDFAAVHQSECRWYKGDLHLHSKHSDGRVTQEEQIFEANRQEMDYIAPTEHSALTTKYPLCRQLVLPATEMTWDNHGHYNIWGVREFIDYASCIDGAANKNDALNRLFSYCHKRGYVVSISHPFPYGWKLLHNFDLANISCIEVINAPHQLNREVDNEKALRFWDFLWQHGICLMAVGGSDSHKKEYFLHYSLGLPTTQVYCDGLSVNNVLGALKSGHTFIHAFDEAEICFHRIGNVKSLVLPGGYFKGTFVMQARCLHPVDWELIQNGNVVYRTHSATFYCEPTVAAGDYVRLQARKDNEVIVLVNPVHAIEIQPKHCFFQDVLAEFQKVDHPVFQPLQKNIAIK